MKNKIKQNNNIGRFVKMSSPHKYVEIELLQNHNSLFISGLKILKYKFLILFSILMSEK